MILPMYRIHLVGLRRDLHRVMERLQEAGVVHLEAPPAEMAQHLQALGRAGEILEERRRLETLQSHLTRLLDRLGLGPPSGTMAPPSLDLETIEARVARWAPEIDHWYQRQETLTREWHLLSRYEAILSALLPLIPHFPRGEHLATLGVILQEPADPALERLRQALDRLLEGRYGWIFRPLDARTRVGLLLFPRQEASRVYRIAWEAGLAEIRLPVSYQGLSFTEALRRIMERRVALPVEREGARWQLHLLAHRAGQELQEAYQVVADRLERLRTTQMLLGTERTFMVYGWIPEEKLEHLQNALQGIPGLVLEWRLPRREEWPEVPVVLSNSTWLRPFERLVRVVSLPRYGTVDPTPWVGGFLPLFFGMMLGDVGYGALLLLGALWVRHRWSTPLVRDLAAVVAWGALVSIGFGVVFGEYLGWSPHEASPVAGWPGGWWERHTSLIASLAVSLGVGVGHLLVGLGLWIRTVLRTQDHHGLWVGLGKMAVLLGGSGGVASGIAGWTEGLWVSTGLLTLGVLGLGWFEGWRGGIDFLKLSTHTLSYARIMGFGAASVFLAFLANQFAAQIPMWTLAVGLWVVLHGLNLLMGLYAPLIQSLRLQYVEFFDKFFQGGGRAYQPFTHWYRKGVVERR